jgi:hypothetical protein
VICHVRVLPGPPTMPPVRSVIIIIKAEGALCDATAIYCERQWEYFVYRARLTRRREIWLAGVSEATPVLGCLKDDFHIFTYSNCSAATLLGKPLTMAVISHGLNLSIAVCAAPPLAMPLCCRSRRTGFGVEPTYRLLCRTVDRNR